METRFQRWLHKGLPEGYFAISANGDELAESASIASVKLRSLAKIAHRGRSGTSCPAMPTLRFTLHEKRPSIFCVVFPYLSLSCLFGAPACYLSILSYPSPPARLYMPGKRKGVYGCGPRHRGARSAMTSVMRPSVSALGMSVTNLSRPTNNGLSGLFSADALARVRVILVYY